MKFNWRLRGWYSLYSNWIPMLDGVHLSCRWYAEMEHQANSSHSMVAAADHLVTHNNCLCRYTMSICWWHRYQCYQTRSNKMTNSSRLVLCWLVRWHTDSTIRTNCFGHIVVVSTWRNSLMCHSRCQPVAKRNTNRSAYFGMTYYWHWLNHSWWPPTMDWVRVNGLAKRGPSNSNGHLSMGQSVSWYLDHCGNDAIAAE